MKYTRITGTVIAFCMAVSLFAQQYKATIPYQMVGGKMVIEMKVNGTARPFIFDRGTYRTHDQSLPSTTDSGYGLDEGDGCKQRGKLLQNCADRKSDNSR